MQERFAIQLYSLREEAQKDFPATLKYVSACGFRSVEFAGYFGLDGKEAKIMLDDLGLKGISSHVGYNLFENNFAQEVEFNHAVGNKTIILPWFTFNTLEEAKRDMDKIAAMAEAFRKEGFDFGYHNHAHEFKPLDDKGTCAMDLLLTVPGLKLQPDVFWVKTAGIDPLQFVREHKDRLISLHMKEYGADGKNVEWGNGILPWKELTEAAGVAYDILEQEEYSCDPKESIRICAENINRVFGN